MIDFSAFSDELVKIASPTWDDFAHHGDAVLSRHGPLSPQRYNKLVVDTWNRKHNDNMPHVTSPGFGPRHFLGERQKIAQYNPNRRAGLIGGAAGAGLGIAGAAKMAPKLKGKARLAALAGGALLGGLGGREIGEGAVTAGRGLRATAAQTRYAMS